MKTLRDISLVMTLLFIPAVSHAEPLYADTNGDGVTDTITLERGLYSYSSTYVRIYHPNKGTTTSYNLGTGLTPVDLITTADTNGLAGKEVVVRALSGTGSLTSYLIYIIEDARVRVRQYNFGSGLINSQFQVIGTGNTDGLAGDEVAVRLAWSNTGLDMQYAVAIVDDARVRTRNYKFGIGLTSFSTLAITDTDGRVGKEIVSQIGWSGGGAVHIIDDARATTRSYDPGSGYVLSFAVQAIRDYDGLAGDEVCYHARNSTSTFYRLIVDRTGSVLSRSGC